MSDDCFLDQKIEGLSGKSADEVARMIDKIAKSVTDAQVSAQIASHERSVADMKAYMEKAAADGVLPQDDTDETSNDGSILLRNKKGDYNPIMDKLQGKAKPAVKGAKKETLLLRPIVLLRIPTSGDVSNTQLADYAKAAVLNSIEHGEAPHCFLFTLINAIGNGHVTDAVLAKMAEEDASHYFSNQYPIVVYTGCDLLKEYADNGKNNNGGVSIRNLPLAVANLIPASNFIEHDSVSAASAASSGNLSNLKEDEVDPMPNKERVNRFSNNGADAAKYPDGVAGYSIDGRAIPINNAGASFDPTLPNVLGDMEYRNRLLSAPKFDGTQWFYRPFDKLRWLVVAYMGPENCNIKTKEYFMCVFGACAKKSECAALVKHIRNQKNCYNGAIYNLGVVKLGDWFQTSPPLFAKDATATYSNPLHREYMEAYANEQKRATVELEQRVMDEEVQARSKKNTLKQQLIEKGMNPDLAPTPAVAQAEIAVKQREAAAKDELRRQAVAAEDKRLQQLEQNKQQVTATPAAQRAPFNSGIQQEARPAALMDNAGVAPARVAGGVRVKRAAPLSAEATKKALGGLEKL